MPAADRSSIALSTPSPGRRILSRIASPFAAKSRSITDFYIQPDDPHKQYSPGDIVKGSIRLRVLRPVRVTHIVVSLHGYAQVFKNPGSPGEGFRANTGYVGTGRGKKSGEYFGNGFASLFEDEVVLCGDGRLAEGSYQFNFELEFPDQDLPSSIDFERGTISYMITGTMTRPTTISPTITCDRKIYFVERIDISPLYPPKARTITLEPISRRSRAKHRAKHKAKRLVDQAERRSRKTDSVDQSDLQHDDRSIAPSTLADSDPPPSPTQSDISFDSAMSSSGRTSHPDSSAVSPGNSYTKGNRSKSSLSTKMIHTNIESCVGGCLRGDSIPIKVTVNHTKHIKSMNGVIVTLYRQARVDMHPAIPLGPTEKGTNRKYEDYYPKSVTGLGGLSLSGAGSSHIFRKDLSQSVQPLIVNPETLTASVTVKVTVPEDSFPTISTVPGAMISFKYFVEVVVDIQGKLATPERALSNLGGLASTPISGPEDYGFDGERIGGGAFGPHLVDTAPVRRDKGVVSCTFEVVVGTRDSERRKGKRKVESPATVERPQPESTPVQEVQEYPRVQDHNDYAEHPPEGPWEYGSHDWSSGQAYGNTTMHYPDQLYEQVPEVTMPQLPDESQLSEKERLRRQEERLLPSQPPDLDLQAGNGAHEATAPYLPEEYEESPHFAAASSSAAPVYHPPHAHDTVSTAVDLHNRGVPAPIYSPAEGSSSHIQPPLNDDKQELQRRRLEMEASAPPADEDDQAGLARGEEMLQPSAPPVIDNDALVPSAENEHDSHGEATGLADLPRYER